ncbi:sarcosine oxidase subunit alpha family protein [Aquibium carbonis]|uniref:Sarcosine oxidase subunit alpha family protein n=1 Tax=Aquibium carbonis TaxID=2495581 RepID=A0A3R9YG47_9HYPH|nr:sarcosine oxidase subunit alpha family protein [Aquibium carbonis]RST86843.1 sarcosine oxidase subunit alpha family protein [Aquibium carbonis]
MTARRISSHGAGRSIAFTFDGQALSGAEGDTIASALLAAGVRVVGRSFKYHRPRGIVGAGAEEPNAIVDVTLSGKTTPNVRATTEPLVDGMSVRSVNASPTAATDRAGILDRFASFIPAGFYYKTFLWPDWHLFEPRIRAMAGLGRLDRSHEPAAESPAINARCDVLVVGAGPAGLAAARALARNGESVVMVDDQDAPGGSLRHRHADIDGMPGVDWAEAIVAQLRAAGHTVLSRTTAFGVYDHGLVLLWQRRTGLPDALWQVRARRIVVAAGAIERPLVFPDNDQPGVMSAEAALVYLKRFGVLVSQRIVVATNNDKAYGVAAALHEAGAWVMIADTRPRGAVAPHAGVEVIHEATIDRVSGAQGVSSVTVSGRSIKADCLLTSGGFTPTVHLFCQAKGRLRLDETIAGFVPGDPVAGMAVAGAANGAFSLSRALAEGHATARGASEAPRASSPDDSYAIAAVWPAPRGKARQWIDLQNDVTVKDVALAARENFRSVEHLKRYTTLGMATDQGKTSNMNGLAAMAAITGRTIEETGTTTYRPPFVPVPFTVVAGRRRGEFFNPVKRLALENQHRAAGAVFREYGGWLRPGWYGKGKPADEIAREARQARETVGILDGSPLGKIEVIGPQAGAVVDYNSYQTLATLKPGRIRYGFMLTESGVIYDDGVVSKVADDHYVVSCSSGHVGGVVLRLEEWRQDRFDRRQVMVHNSTPEWATLTATGPRSRDLVAMLALGVDLSDEALPHMGFADGGFSGGPARVSRVSFTGDRSYEVSVPTGKALALHLAMMEAGRALDAVLLGSEALLLLRAEKGYIIAGKDTDGTTMPQDLGITGPRDRRAGEFVGKRSLFTENALRDDRQQGVGLTVADGEPPLPTGAHAVETRGGARRSIGFVTSSYQSPVLGRPVALALVERGLSRMGETIEFVHLGATRRATIAPVCAFDPEGTRIHG